MNHLKLITNINCTFDGKQWFDENQRMSYFAYSKDLKNTNFNIDLTIKDNNFRFAKFVNVVLNIHFYEFPNDFEFRIESKTNYDFKFEDVKQFLYAKNINNYIKDELAYRCGIVNDKFLNDILNAISKEIESL